MKTFLIIISLITSAQAAPLPKDSELIERNYGKELIHIALTPAETAILNTKLEKFNHYSSYRATQKTVKDLIKIFSIYPSAVSLFIGGTSKIMGWYLRSSNVNTIGNLFLVISVGAGTFYSTIFGIALVAHWKEYQNKSKELQISPKDQSDLVKFSNSIDARINRSCQVLGGISQESSLLPLLIHPTTITLEDFKLGRVYFKGKPLSLEKSRRLGFLSEASF